MNAPPLPGNARPAPEGEAPAPRNPFLLPDHKFSDGAPPLNCAHAEPCPLGCHVEVGRFRECFTAFQEAVRDLGALQESGLLVAVGGPSKCGKTSLVNRCAAWAKRELGGMCFDDAPVRAVIVNLTHAGGRQGAEDLTAKVATRIVLEVNAQASGLLRSDVTEYRPASPLGGDQPPDLDDLMVHLTNTMARGTVLILLAPPADDVRVLDPYWDATCRKAIWLVESTDRQLEDRWRKKWTPAGGARSCYLDMGGLRRGDIEKFVVARAGAFVQGDAPPGDGRNHPRLHQDALETLTALYGETPMVQIGAIQKLLYGVYAYYLQKGRGADTIITGADILSYVRRLAEGGEG
ncbi:hypothetical protein [Actinomadura opuntiae]|uniref:hypothetical protein n=1 Tax=Actinomadura sp. OS1-43 TaxID=604315 RepID=UPI00255AE1DF|nr:hypothetical protein [Actinomadura sp. OS1-43]MDL4813638.1 hypothetical protein [Actinomadura sp. OS1-43]